MAHDCLASREERIPRLSFFEGKYKIAFRVISYTRIIKTEMSTLL